MAFLVKRDLETLIPSPTSANKAAPVPTLTVALQLDRHAGLRSQDCSHELLMVMSSLTLFRVPRPPLPFFLLLFSLILAFRASQQVEKVLDAKWFQMEKERWPDGFDPVTFMEEAAEEEKAADGDVVS